jgi:hypothetical protein
MWEHSKATATANLTWPDNTSQGKVRIIPHQRSDNERKRIYSQLI